MSWLGFANHFLSNKRQHGQSWINRTCSGNCLWWETSGYFGLFLFCFCLARAERVTDAKDFGNQEGDRFMCRKPQFPFFSFLLVTILYVYSDIFRVQRPFCTFSFVFFRSWLGIFFFFCFFPILDREFLFSFSFFQYLTWNFFFSFAFFRSLIGNFFLFFHFRSALAA